MPNWYSLHLCPLSMHWMKTHFLEGVCAKLPCVAFLTVALARAMEFCDHTADDFPLPLPEVSLNVLANAASSVVASEMRWKYLIPYSISKNYFMVAIKTKSVANLLPIVRPLQFPTGPQHQRCWTLEHYTGITSQTIFKEPLSELHQRLGPIEGHVLDAGNRLAPRMQLLQRVGWGPSKAAVDPGLGPAVVQGVDFNEVGLHRFAFPRCYHGSNLTVIAIVFPRLHRKYQSSRIILEHPPPPPPKETCGTPSADAAELLKIAPARHCPSGDPPSQCKQQLWETTVLVRPFYPTTQISHLYRRHQRDIVLQSQTGSWIRHIPGDYARVCR